MGLRTSIAYSSLVDSFRAGKESAEELLKKLGKPPQFFLLFPTFGHDFLKIIEGIQSVAPGVPICGCSTAGTVSSLHSDESLSLGLAGFCSEKIQCTPIFLEDVKTDSLEAGALLAKQIQAAPSGANRLLLLFTLGLDFNVGTLFSSLKENLGFHLDCVGGFSGNDYISHSTFQFLNTSIVEQGAVGILLTGDFKYHLGISHGAVPIGNPWRVTKAHSNHIFELNHQPVFEVLKEYFGDEAVEDFGHSLNQVGFGISFKNKNYSNEILVRTIAGINPKEGYIAVGSDIKEGTMIRLIRRDKDKVLEGTEKNGRELLAKVKDPEKTFFLYVDCAGRGSFLFGSSTPDPECLKNILGDKAPFLGFYSFGEFGPVAGENEFHNYTGILLGVEE